MSAPERAKGPTVAPESPLKTDKSKRKYSPRSTATEAQYDRIITMLRTSPKSTFDFRRVGICAPAARIKELNDRFGYSIPRIDLRDMWDDEGFRHQRIAVYALEREPVEVQQ